MIRGAAAVVVVVVITISLVAAPFHVDAFQISSFHQRHRFPNYCYRNSLSSSCIISNEKWGAAVDGVRPSCKGSPYHNMMRMASPMLQEDMNGDASLTDDEQYPNGDTVESPTSSQSQATITSDNKLSSTTTKLKSSSRRRQPLPTNWLGEKNYILFTAVLIGLFTGINIAVFKTAVEFVREVLYGDGINLQLISPYLWGGGGGGGGGSGDGGDGSSGGGSGSDGGGSSSSGCVGNGPLWHCCSSRSGSRLRR